MKTMTALVAVLALGLLLAPAAAPADTLLLGAANTGQFALTGKTANLWKGAKGITASWQVEEVTPGLYRYTYNISAKQNKRLKAQANKVVVGVADATNVTVNGKALANKKIVNQAAATVFKTGDKKLAISFLSYQMPDSSFLVVRGNQRLAVISNLAFAAAIAPTADGPQVIEPTVEDQQPIDDPQTAVVPLPLAGWAGLSLLGTLGVGKTLRRRRDQA